MAGSWLSLRQGALGSREGHAPAGRPFGPAGFSVERVSVGGISSVAQVGGPPLRGAVNG